MKKSKLLSKIASVVAACLMVTSTAAYVSAEAPKTYTVYDDAGNAYIINEDEVLGVLYDKDGNVKEQVTISPRSLYVNGAERTLAPGESFVTYQYEVSVGFSAGFYYYFKHATTPSTTPGGKLKITLQDSSSIGGTRRNLFVNTFSTTYSEAEADIENEYGLSKSIHTTLVSSSRPYYNACFENVGSNTITVCWFVGKD